MYRHNMESAFVIFIVLALGYLYFRKLMSSKKFTKAHRADGKTVIITGADSDIGKETAIGMAERGAKVIMACRDVSNADIVRLMIIKKTRNPNIKVMHCDLASFESIRKFAETFLTEEKRLDVLINNESVMGVEKTLTKDGLEMHMGVNHLGHFLLTLLLIGRLKETTPSRIVTVSHLFHTFVHLDKSDMNSEKSYNRFQAFLRSKLANVLFTVELAEKLSGSGITAAALHPGVYSTDSRNRRESSNSVLSRIYDVFSKIFLQNPKSAAQNTLFAALDFNLQNVSGVFWNSISSYKPGLVNADAHDPELRSWFWDYSEKMTGIQFPEKTWRLDDYNRNARKKRDAIINNLLNSV